MYGLPFAILLFVLTPTLHQAIADAMSSIVGAEVNGQRCDIYGSCAPTHRPIYFWLAAALVVLSLVWFAWLTRRDTGSRTRLYLHLFSFAYGVVWFAVGAQSGVEQSLRGGFNLVVSRQDTANTLTTVIFGLFVAVAFGL